MSLAVLQGVGNQTGVAHRFTDYRDLIAHTDVDAILISNPHVYHAEVAMAAMAAGKHVLIEKPMCISLAQADALIDQERKSGIVAQVGFMRRYAPAFTEAVELIRDLKDIRLARVHDAIGRNALIIDQISNVIRPTDLPERVVKELRSKQIEMVTAAVGVLPAPWTRRTSYFWVYQAMTFRQCASC
ncbi:Gfo/Idh/MocA family protein [Bradyrhizobium sp. RDT10]